MTYPILYKRSVNGKICTFQAFIENDSYYTTSGFIDGVKTTSQPTKCFAKNLNKSNATTAEQQAVAEVEAMYRKRQDLGYWDDVSKIDTPVYFKPVLAQDFNDHKDKIKFPLHSDAKLDGIRCIIKSDGMWSRNGKPIVSAPHIFEALTPLFEKNPDLILDGELFAEKSICDFNTIISCVRKTKPTKEDLETSKQIQYWIYDIPSEPGKFTDRKQILCGLQLPECCVVVQTTKCSNLDELNTKYKEYLDQGYEGQMIRIDHEYENKRSKYLLKRKEFIDEEFIILGYEEGIGNLSGKVGKLSFKTQDGIEFNAAVNGTHEYLAELWLKREELIGKEATVKYFEKTTDGSLRFPKVVNIDRSWE